MVIPFFLIMANLNVLANGPKSGTGTDHSLTDREGGAPQRNNSWEEPITKHAKDRGLQTSP